MAVEIDGREFHKDPERDAERDGHLEEKGIKVVRIQAVDVFTNPNWVKVRLRSELGSIQGTALPTQFVLREFGTGGTLSYVSNIIDVDCL